MSDILTRIAQQREERVQDLHLDLPIPTWDRSLVGRFNVLPRKEVEKFGQRKQGPEADADFVIRATRELYLLDPNKETDGERMEDNDDYARIEDEHGTPITWTAALAEKLNQPNLSRSREVLEYCFGGNLIAVAGFSGKLFRWMQNTDSDVAEAISGE